ncbi:hypothetical protein C0Z18_32145 [Trinickia dabaoshanensis]|uniref:Uncharacterized protein n=1 Tax=Trinickia dabaoshanensis TaxID=564714 RepID=A0A2N7VAZ0_9BURK|nr:hypothetical protein [Trinickia dabaoshanensis]PMS14331.1 hypothetical protein C0Z18_32145 [Trinickia dabaoshanensis]
MSNMSYHKSATKDVRPFFGAASLEEAVDNAQIRLFEDQPFTDAVSFTIEEQEVPRLAVVVKPNLSEATLAGGAIARGKLALAITAVNPFLKKTVLIEKVLLSKEAPDEIAVGAEVLERLGGGANVTIEVALCLASSLAKEVGKPFMQGHWLSKKSFDLRPPKLAEDFGVDPMEDDGWKAMGFPAKTLYHVEYYSGVNEQASKDRPIAKVYVHADVYKKLAADNLPKMSRSLMAFLAAEIPCQILAASYADWKDADEVDSRSPLAAFLKRINRVQPCTLQQLKRLVDDPGMSKLRAILHADQQSVRQVAEV